MAPFDLVFIILLLAGLALGFFQGTVKLVVAIIAFYIGIVLASLYFLAVGNYFRSRLGTSIEVGQTVAFALILLVSFLILIFAGFYTFRYAKAPLSLNFIDKIVGTLLGLVLGAFVIGMFATILRYLFIYHSAVQGVNLPFMVSLQGAVRASHLLPVFSDHVLPLIYRAVRPMLPEEASMIFMTQ